MAKTALITGATGGLGREFARLFARSGYDLVLVGRDEDKLALMAQQLHDAFVVETYTFAVDLSGEDAVVQVVGFTEAAGLHIDALVNNAGFGDYGDFAHASLDKQTQMINLNVRTLMQLTYWYLGPMLDCNHGYILNVASVAAFMPGPMMSVYFATKAFVLSFTEALAAELAGSRVHITALCPGPTDTNFWNSANAGNKGMFAKTSFATAKEVAQFGFASLMAGKVVAVPGFMNKVLTQSVRLLPRGAVRRVVYGLLR